MKINSNKFWVSIIIIGVILLSLLYLKSYPHPQKITEGKTYRVENSACRTLDTVFIEVKKSNYINFRFVRNGIINTQVLCTVSDDYFYDCKLFEVVK